MTSLIPSDVLTALIKTAKSTPPGPWVEVGVYQGGSALALYAVRDNRTLHLFDTWTGIPVCDPSKGDTHKIGEFDGRSEFIELQRKMPDANFYEGVFPSTLPDDLCGIAFCHIDVDQYASVSDCIKTLEPRLCPGGVMWFDDFHDLPGARRAVLEHFSMSQLHAAPGGRRFIVCKK